MICIFILLPIALLLQESLIHILVLFLLGDEGNLHFFDGLNMVVNLLPEQSGSLLELDDGLIFLLLELKEADSHFLLVLDCQLESKRLPAELILQESLSLMQVIILLLELADLESQRIDFFHHLHLAVAVGVEVSLQLLVLLQDTIIQDLYLILVVSLQLAQLQCPIILIVLRLVRYLLEERLVGCLHLLFLVEDILQLVDQSPDLFGVARLGGG